MKLSTTARNVQQPVRRRPGAALILGIVGFAAHFIGAEALTAKHQVDDFHSGSKVLAAPCADRSGCKDQVPGAARQIAIEVNPIMAVWSSLAALAEHRFKYWQLSEKSHQGQYSDGLEEQGLVPKPSPPPEQVIAPDAPDEQVITEEGRQVQSKILLASVVMVVSTYLIGFAALFFAKYHPSPSRAQAYITVGEEDRPHGPDTDEETGADEAAKAGPGTPVCSSRSMSGRSSARIFRQLSQYLVTGHVAVDGEQLVNDIGISAMCVFDPDEMSGITKLPNKVAVPLIAIQSMFLQLGLLHFLSTQVLPRPGDAQYGLPVSIILIAVYLHFLNCGQELPYSWQIFHHLHDFHSNSCDLTIFGAVLITDAFVIPLLSFVLGGLYLCTSRTIGDAILNAVAVAFVREIDNWILGLNTRSDFLAGKIQAKTVHIPINRTIMRRIAWTVIFIPIVPLMASLLICWLGFVVLNL